MQLRQGQKVLILGLAKSGEAVARLLIRHGCQVTVNERRDRQDEDFEAESLEKLGAHMVFGGHPDSLLDDEPEFIVKNPGIPYTVPLLQRAMTLGIPIYTEIEVASWLTDAPILAITGSNGKTTTTTMVGEMLAEANMAPVVAGNIGIVMSGVVDSVPATSPIVLEVSSFQLMGTASFHPQIAALLNLYPAHLDYHQTFEAYVDAKWRIFQNMTQADTAVLNYDQPMIRDRVADVPAQVLWFSRTQSLTDGVCVHGGTIVYRHDGQEDAIVSTLAVALKGEHNLENALAASAIAIAYGTPLTAIKEVLMRFRGVEHRLEFVTTVNNVDYYNDSKSTNPQATLPALRSFAKNVIWIAGGLNRGDDFSVLVPSIEGRVKAAILLGQTAGELAQVCQSAGVDTVKQATSIEQAVMFATRMAEPGDIVLLSPASASWDMFASFEERGRMFKDAVHTL